MIVRFNPVDLSPDVWEYIYNNTTLSSRSVSEDDKQAAFDLTLEKIMKLESLPSNWRPYINRVISSQFSQALGKPSGEDIMDRAEREAGAAASGDEMLGFEERFSAESVTAGSTDQEIVGEEESIQRKLDKPTLEIVGKWREEFLSSPSLSESERKVLEWHTLQIPFRVIAKRLPAFLVYQEAYKRCLGPKRGKQRMRSYRNPSYLRKGEDLYKKATEMTLQALNYRPVVGTPHFSLIRQANRTYQEATRYFLVACGQSPRALGYFSFTQKDVADLYFSAIKKFKDAYDIPEDLRELRNPYAYSSPDNY